MGQAMTRVSTHLPRVHQHRQRSMRRLMVMLLRHRRVVRLRRAFMKDGRPGVVERGPMTLRAVSVRLLALIGRMRVLW